MLALETSARAGEVALVRGGAVLGTHTLSAERRNASELLPTMQALLSAAGLRATDIGVVCYSQGPGSFTGLRVAATVARMLQAAVGCRVVAVPTLEVIARNALGHSNPPPRIAALLDAKRGQIFAALFERSSPGELRSIEPAGLHEAAAWLAKLPPETALLGEGVRAHADVCQRSGHMILEESCWPPRAEQVAVIGRRMMQAGAVCEPADILPLYLRVPEAEEVYEMKRAAARQKRGE